MEYLISYNSKTIIIPSSTDVSGSNITHWCPRCTWRVDWNGKTSMRPQHEINNKLLFWYLL